ncbi:hypothetical protein [Caballeronia sp. ATUFL_M1_KS5A]|uniref:hypothetical protein n=1 Tax=Caballeronia sp. ATUFL_M1_KS5A TaxID=2921778 RepID=UPI0020295D78|nr:hypothetical protein [Caballeronia sp. ATUFL_M1_KS5A]
MASAGSLIFELAADVSRLRADMNKAQTEIKSSLDSIAKSSAGTAVLMGAQFAMEFARGFAEKVGQALENVDAMSKMAQSIGTATENLSALAYAGQLADVSTEQLATAFKKLNESMLESKDPASKSAAAFKALGLNAAELWSKDPAEQFKAVAEAISGFRDGSEKAAVAVELCGKAGMQLIPLLNAGAEGLDEAAQEAERLGLIVSTETGLAIENLNDDMTRLEKVGEGAAVTIAGRLAPALDTFAKSAVEASTTSELWQDTLESIGAFLSGFIINLTRVFGTISIGYKEALGYASAAKQFMSGDFAAAAKTVGDTIKTSQSASADLEIKIQQTRERSTKQAREESAAWAVVGRNADRSGKEILHYSDALDKVGHSAKKNKKELDDFKTLMDQLAADAAKLAAQGDPMKEFLANPKLQALTPEQQKAAIAYKQWIVDTTAALKAKADAETRDDEAKQEELDDLIAQIEATEKFADATKRAIDPVVEYREAIIALEKAKRAGALTDAEYADAQKYYQKQLQDSVKGTDPLKDQIKELERAIEGFGQKSSDAFVDFIFGAEDVATSFRDMVASMLKDIAKMLVYENVFKGMFAGISKGPSGGWADFLGTLFRQGGGPVSAGDLYRVNEIPGRAEYFIPNVPGRIVTDAGASGGGGGVVVNVNMQGDRATQDTTASDKQMAELGNRIATVVRSVIATEKRSGGLLAPTR